MSSGMVLAVVTGTVLVCVLVCAGIRQYTRQKYIRFTNNMIDAIERLERGESLDTEVLDEESLDGKAFLELTRLAKIYHTDKDRSSAQKQEIQQMVSDISHQLKTPIANILMYSDIVSDEALSEEQRKKYLKVMKNQVEKLDFLVKALVKMSRVESAMIVLKPQEENLYQCIAQAVSAVSAAAEEKGLHVEVECQENDTLILDKKWTAEAIGNVLDNAVKYTPEGGHIWISVEHLEMFTRIDISDDGIGIEEAHYNDVFRRFWRGQEVHKEQGVGIGLYLTREIITRQGGYVKVSARTGGGSRFSLYLPNYKK